MCHTTKPVSSKVSSAKSRLYVVVFLIRQSLLIVVSVYCIHYVSEEFGIERMTLDNSKYSNTDTIIIIINNNSNRS